MLISLAGAMSTAELGKILSEVIREKKVHMITADTWKYDFIKQMNIQMKKSRNPKEIISGIMKTPLKKHGKEAMKLIPIPLRASRLLSVLCG